MNNHAHSSLIGGALGDALGYSREFHQLGEILEHLPGQNWRHASFHNAPNPDHFRDGDGKVLISDDTQMTVATGRAILSAGLSPTVTPQEVADALSHAYTVWSQHPDNVRAPGNACMRACAKLGMGMTWQDATDIQTMGCGANMRVAPIALAQNIGPRTARDYAMLSSAITHAHPGALAATALTADAIRAVSEGYEGRALLDFLLTQCRSGCDGYYPHWALGDLWDQSVYNTPEAYMQAGFVICAKYLARAEVALNSGWAGDTDPCMITGEAWTAPEALAGAVLTVVGLWGNPVAVLQRAACSNGDSDSLAAIAGNIRGASGVQWPTEWSDQLEIGPARELHKIAREL